MDIIDITLLSVHALAANIGFMIKFKSQKSMPVILGLLGIVISVLFMMIILDGGPGGPSGTHGAWYLIFSVMTVGVLPFITLWAAFTSGRFLKALSF